MIIAMHRAITECHPGGSTNIPGNLKKLRLKIVNNPTIKVKLREN